MNIAVLHSSFAVWGGAELIIARFTDMLVKDGHMVHVAAGIMPSEAKEQFNPDVKLFQGMPTDIYDVIHPVNHPAEVWAHNWQSKTPIVWYHNEPPTPILLGMPATDSEIEIVQGFNRTVVADDFNKKRVKDIYGVDATVVPYGIDCDQFATPIEHAKDKLCLNDKFVVVVPGWINKMKRQTETLPIARKLKEHVPNLKWIYLGHDKSPEAQVLRHQIQIQGLSNNVEIVSWDGMSREQLKTYYYAADWILCPYGPQGGWLTIFEVIATGQPVIVSDQATAASIVLEKKLAIVANMDNHNDVIRIIRNEDIDYPTDKAREWIHLNLTWQNYSDKLLGIFKEAQMK